MKERCRFCKLQSLFILYTPNDHQQIKDISLFACSNCGFGLHGTIVKCRSCGMIYLTEDLSQSEIVNFYEKSEDNLYLSEQQAREKTFRNYLEKMKRYYPRKGKLLDIGTNTGLFVKVAQEDGWDAVGLEPNKEAVKFALKKYDLKLINKPLKTNLFPSQTFDVVTMWDVIEHFVDPIEQLEIVAKILKTDGMFAFSTVDPESLSARLMGTRWPWYMEMHRVFLSRYTAKKYLLRTGFSKVVFTPHWRYLSAGYLFPRLALSILGQKAYLRTDRLIKRSGLSKLLVHYYANDLYDCYAFK